MPRKWLLLLCLALLSACAHRGAPATGAQVRATPALTSPSAADAEIVAAVDYWQLLQTLPLADLETEFAQVQQRWLQDGASVRTRLQMVLLLQVPNTPFRNFDLALQLIDTYVESAGDSSLTNFFWWLSQGLYDQRAAEQRMRNIVKRNDVLQQQLEQLKSIERTIQERQPPPANTPG